MREGPSSLLRQVHDLVESREKELDQVQASLARDRQALDLEKEQMQHISVADNDILTLDVGGTAFGTNRSTLTQAEGSALAARFSERWEQSLSRDDQGRNFLDFDPYSFQQILLCLRMRAIADSIDSKWSPRIESDKQEPFDSLVRYLQLEQHKGLTAAMKAAVADFPTLVSAAKGVLMSQDQHRATVLPDSNFTFKSVAFSQLEAPVCYLKCKVHVLEEGMRNRGMDWQKRGHGTYSALVTNQYVRMEQSQQLCKRQSAAL